MVTKKTATKKKATNRKQGRVAPSEQDRLALLRSLMADLDGTVDADANT